MGLLNPYVKKKGMAMFQPSRGSPMTGTASREPPTRRTEFAGRRKRIKNGSPP
jgi:hypothetical protein